MGYKDTELQFMDLVATDVADASDQEDTFDPGLRYEDRLGFRIKKVEWEIGDTAQSLCTLTSTDVSTIVLTTRNETAIPEFNADGVIMHTKIHYSGITTSGAQNQVIMENGTVFPGKGLLVVTDRFYTWFSNESGATRKVRMRIWYTIERLSDADYREAFEVWART